MKGLTKYVIFQIFAVLIFIFSPQVYAAGVKYFEFNPDNSSSLKISSVASPVAEIFLPQNDFLGGFDVWIDNSGDVGSVDFSLANESGTVLSTKTVSVPHINPIDGGQKFHVDFNSQIAVTGNKKYSITISTSMPDLRIYYADRIQLLSHNAPYSSVYASGVARLGAEEQNFSFKFALYENTETVPPSVSNVRWTPVSTYQMNLAFNASEPVDYKISYGLAGQTLNQSTDFAGSYRFCGSNVADCNLSINVSPNSAYQYILTVKDSWGNQSQTAGNFQSGIVSTQSPTPTMNPTKSVSPSATPSVKLAISDFKPVSITDKDIEVSWHTNKAADSTLIISYSTYQITITSEYDPTLELEHDLSVSGLNKSTTYTARVISRDFNDLNASTSFEFTTLAKAPTPTPIQTPSNQPSQSPLPSSSNLPTNLPSQTPSQNAQVTVSQNNGGSLTVTWNPSGQEPSNGYKIDVFDQSHNLVKTLDVSSGVHQTDLFGLPDGQNTVIVYENNNGVYKKIGPPANVKAQDNSWRWWTIGGLVAVLAILAFVLKKLTGRKTAS